MVDNTTEFIEVVKRYDIVYNAKNPNYKNFLEKLNAWGQIAEELGITVDAAKRKWKNLRDSYTKYLRSFRIGTKTSKKYQFWAHADHMEFLKPHQGPGRPLKHEEADEIDSDIGFQVLKKATPSEDSVLIAPPPPLPIPIPHQPTLAPAPTAAPAPASAPPLTPPTPAKIHIQPSFILAKNVSNGFITQIPTTPLDLVCTTTSTLSTPIVAKIRAITTPAPAFLNNNIPNVDVTSTPPPKIRKISPQNANIPDNFDVGSILRANKEMDSTCLFFLSLAKSVRTMPKRYQAMVKMRCMRIVGDAEVEIESNFECDETGGFVAKQQTNNQVNNCGSKSMDGMENGTNESNLQQGTAGQIQANGATDTSEHFLYVMSPSRVETMIDVSSEDEGTNGTN